MVRLIMAKKESELKQVISLKSLDVTEISNTCNFWW